MALDTHIAPPVTVTVVAEGATATALGVQDQWITVCAVGAALHVRFGTASLGAAQTTDWPLAANEKARFYIGANTNYVSIVGTGATLRWFRN